MSDRFLLPIRLSIGLLVVGACGARRLPRRLACAGAPKPTRALASILDQTYPLIELLLIYNGDDRRQAQFARQFSHVRSHIPVRLAATTFPIEDESDRIRALEQAQAKVRGSWLLVGDSNILLESSVIESALEYAGSEEICALGLRPGAGGPSLIQRLVAPSLEWLSRMIDVVNRGRGQAQTLGSGPFLLMNAHSHELLRRINHVPGVLNEWAWSTWGFQAEGLKTFEGDGSGWIWRESPTGAPVSNIEVEPARSRLVRPLLVSGALGSVARDAPRGSVDPQRPPDRA